VPDQATAQLLSSSAAATALVRQVEQHTRAMQLANGLGMAAVPSTPAATAPGQARTLRLPRLPRAGMAHALAVQNLSSDMCSSGSITLDVDDALINRFANDTTNTATLLAGDTLAFQAGQCVVKAPLDLGEVALGDFGVGATVNGRFVLQVLQYSGSDLLLQLRYSGFSWQPFGQAAYAPLDAVIRFGNQGGQAVYSLQIDELRFLDAPVVAAQGDAVSVVSGALRGAVPASAGTGYADYSYAGWRYAVSTGRASAGQVTVLGANGAGATVAAGTVGYSVSITAQGVTQQYSVGL
jgi:hypothetical protein